MKKLMVFSAASVVAVSSFAKWGDIGKFAAKEAVTTAAKVAVNSPSKDSASSSGSGAEAKKAKNEEAETPKKDKIVDKDEVERTEAEDNAKSAPSYCGKKFDWSFTDDWGFKTEYHTRIASGKEIEVARNGAFQIQNFHNDNYGFSWIGFKSLADLEYALDQLDAYINKCVGWQKVAIENEVEGMRKDDDKTKFAIDREGNRVESFIFCTKKNKKGVIMGCFDVRQTDKRDKWLGDFHGFENDGCVEFWQKLVVSCRKAVELYKAGIAEEEAKAQKRKNAANLFN